MYFDTPKKKEHIYPRHLIHSGWITSTGGSFVKVGWSCDISDDLQPSIRHHNQTELVHSREILFNRHKGEASWELSGGSRVSWHYSLH